MLTVNNLFKSLVFIFLLVLVSCTTKKEKDFYNRNYAKAIKKGQKELIVYKQINYVPAVTVAASLNGELIWSEAIGLASTDLEVPTTRNTKFRIGAISETITALTYNLLVEQGKIQPDSTVKYYLTEFEGEAANVPVKNLVNQSSGIRAENLEEKKWSAIRHTIETGLDVFAKDTLLFEPGEFQLPSIFNYNLLGATIQKAENSSFHKVVKKLVVDTLGLNNTVPDNPFITIPGRPDFFTNNYISQVIKALSVDLRYKLPSRGYLSTADDLVKFGNAFLYSDYISDSIKIKTFRPDKFPGGSSNWANGWFIIENNPKRKVYATVGNETGGSAGLLVYPEQKFVLAITTNLDENTNSLPLFKIANLMLDEIENKKAKE